MSLYSSPPSFRDAHFDKPTLLVCWWITIFSTALILIRTAGRFVRSETLFAEDRIAAIAIIPLFARMACVHVVLVYGTNNADFSGVNLTAQEIRNREIASGLVLLSRIFHAATYVGPAAFPLPPGLLEGTFSGEDLGLTLFCCAILDYGFIRPPSSSTSTA